MQLLPSPQLRPYIKHYLFVENKEALRSHLRIFADGNTGVVFSFGSLLRDTDNKQLPRVFAYGQLTHYRTLFTLGAVSLLIVVFRPFGMSSLLGIPGNNLKNDLMDFCDIPRVKAHHLYDKLLAAGSKEKMSECLDCFFGRLASQSEAGLNTMVSATVNWMLKRRGSFRAEELAAFTGWQQRSVERAFNEVVGISPKSIGGIIKLHYFLGAIRASGARNKFTPVVYDAGYYDQAHLIREFKKITGLTPTAYTSKGIHLAVNLIWFPDENVQF